MAGGRFITIEGGEGAGKSTQIARLKEGFAHADVKALFTREPGGCTSAEDVRALLVQGDKDRWLPESEALLMMAARFEHAKRVIEPALAQGSWVISDRFFDSTRVYQGIGRGLGDDWLQQLYHLLLGNVKPDLTLYLDIDPVVGLERTQGRDGKEHRFESMALEFHQQVRAGFLKLAEEEPERFAVIDASQSEEQVHRAMFDMLNTRLSLQMQEAA